jgi:L-rhamnose mutarotase
MIRNAFKMKLKAGFEAEYKKRHDEIWPELSAELSSAGVSDYSIFLDEETLTLFAVQKLSDDHTADQLPGKRPLMNLVGNRNDEDAKNCFNPHCGGSLWVWLLEAKRNAGKR